MRTAAVEDNDYDPPIVFERAFKELSDAIKLSKDALDDQIIEHAELFRQVCEYLAVRTAQRDLAKRMLEETEATVDSAIRADATDAGEKITEAAVKQRLILDPRVQRARDKLAEHTLTVARLMGLKDAYIERRHAFSKLSDLHGNQYWSEHIGSARGSRAVQADRRERIRETITRNNRERERVS